jgi:signal transduction histidine kinase
VDAAGTSGSARICHSDDHESSLAIVKSESELLLRLVSDIIDFSKLTARAAVLKADRFLVKPEVEAAIRRVFPDTETTPSVDVPEDVAIHFDRDRFGQLLTNLLTNARRYDGPNIEISARREGAGIDLFVRDDGEGIPESDIKTIFARSYKAPANTAARVPGSAWRSVRRSCSRAAER